MSAAEIAPALVVPAAKISPALVVPAAKISPALVVPAAKTARIMVMLVNGLVMRVGRWFRSWLGCARVARRG